MVLRDAVLPFHAKDRDTLALSCANLRSALGIERIVLVGAGDPGLEGCEFIDEARIADLITLAEVRAFFEAGHPAHLWRAGWLYQQFLKLAAPQYVRGLSPTFLVCDTDIVFLRNPYAGTPQDCFPWAQSYRDEYHLPYRQNFERLTGYAAPAGLSFINHHMVMDAGCLIGFKEQLERQHGMRWDRAILASVDACEKSGFSEYDFYGNMMWKWHPQKLLRHQLRIKELTSVPTGQDIQRCREQGYDILSAQRWRRG